MRKKITRRLSFDEVNRMTIREILDTFKIAITADTDEKTLEAGCRKLRTSDELRSKFAVPVSRQWTLLEKKLNLITLIHAAKIYDISYPDWESLKKTLESHAYDRTNVINLPYQTIGTVYDMDAMVYKNYSTKLLNYTNTSLQYASEHLCLITGVDKTEMKDFCDERLVDTILYLKDTFKSSHDEIVRDWYIRLVDKINDNIYPVPDNSMQEFLTPVGCPVKRIAVADYVIFLMIIKHVNEIDHNLVVRLLIWQSHNMIDYAARFFVYEKFVYSYPFKNNTGQISICPQEHLMALNNYIKPEYVYDPDIRNENQSNNEGSNVECPSTATGTAHGQVYFTDIYNKLAKTAECNPYDSNNIDSKHNITDNTEHSAIPSLVWARYMDTLSACAKQMKTEYLKRIKNGDQFTWDDLDSLNNDIFYKLWDIIVNH